MWFWWILCGWYSIHFFLIHDRFSLDVWINNQTLFFCQFSHLAVGCIMPFVHFENIFWLHLNMFHLILDEIKMKNSNENFPHKCNSQLLDIDPKQSLTLSHERLTDFYTIHFRIKIIMNCQVIVPHLCAFKSFYLKICA